jgi:hypothetical protein
VRRSTQCRALDDSERCDLECDRREQQRVGVGGAGRGQRRDQHDREDVRRQDAHQPRAELLPTGHEPEADGPCGCSGGGADEDGSRDTERTGQWPREREQAQGCQPAVRRVRDESTSSKTLPVHAREATPGPRRSARARDGVLAGAVVLPVSPHEGSDCGSISGMESQPEHLTAAQARDVRDRARALVAARSRIVAMAAATYAVVAFIGALFQGYRVGELSGSVTPGRTVSWLVWWAVSALVAVIIAAAAAATATLLAHGGSAQS